jgi:hypothetical protein
VVLSKLDGETRGGASPSIRRITGKPIMFASNGETRETRRPRTGYRTTRASSVARSAKNWSQGRACSARRPNRLCQPPERTSSRRWIDLSRTRRKDTARLVPMRLRRLMPGR